MKFALLSTDAASRARAGVMTTVHGEIPTPVFMPVGTAGSVKAVHARELNDDLQAPIILGNTYHLYLRPGVEILRKAGGIHKFNAFGGNMLTDSGGFQVFSLKGIRKLTEEGCEFRSHIDGSKHFFTPERVIEIQRAIGADIMMAFDECPSATASRQYARKSLDLTHQWLERCFRTYRDTQPLYGYEQSLFPIVQGCVFPDLRRESAQYVCGFEAEGYAIGGLAVGEPAEVMYEIIELCTEILPAARPRYLMGVGTPDNLLEAIARGIDMFDCVMPTRNGRNAMLFTWNGAMNMRNAKWAADFSPIEEESALFVDRQYSKAYLHHLFKAKEILALQIASLHNIGFYLSIVRAAREHILAGDFTPWAQSMKPRLAARL